MAPPFQSCLRAAFMPAAGPTSEGTGTGRSEADPWRDGPRSMPGVWAGWQRGRAEVSALPVSWLIGPPSWCGSQRWGAHSVQAGAQTSSQAPDVLAPGPVPVAFDPDMSSHGATPTTSYQGPAGPRAPRQSHACEGRQGATTQPPKVSMAPAISTAPTLATDLMAVSSTESFQTRVQRPGGRLGGDLEAED